MENRIKDYMRIIEAFDFKKLADVGPQQQLAWTYAHAAYKAAWAVAEHYVHIASQTHKSDGPGDPRWEDRPTERDVIDKMITIMQDPWREHPWKYGD